MKRFNVAVAGCGGMSKTWLEYASARADAAVVALADVRLESAQARAAELGGGIPCFTDIGEAIRATGANLVFDVTLPESHATVARAAFGLGCDLMGEKPMAHSLEAAREVVAEARRRGRFYAVMQNRRYLAGIRAAQALVRRAGGCGIIDADFYLGAHFGGFRDQMESPLVLDMAIHTFDMARFVTGADAVSAWCREGNPPWSWYRGDASAVAVFEMSNGALFTYRGCWCAEGAATTWEADWRVVGPQGTVIWKGDTAPFGDFLVPGGARGFLSETRREEAGSRWTGREGHEGCLDEMFDALASGRKSETDCEDNIKSLAMVFGAIESSRTGKTVTIT
jgi:predicted dehydrogenase